MAVTVGTDQLKRLRCFGEQGRQRDTMVMKGHGHNSVQLSCPCPRPRQKRKAPRRNGVLFNLLAHRCDAAEAILNILSDHANLLEFVLERFVSTPLLRGLVVVIVIIVFVVLLIQVMLGVSLGRTDVREWAEKIDRAGEGKGERQTSCEAQASGCGVRRQCLTYRKGQCARFRVEDVLEAKYQEDNKRQMVPFEIQRGPGPDLKRERWTGDSDSTQS